MVMSEDQDATEEHEQRFIKVQGPVSTVLVRDDTGDRGKMKEQAEELQAKEEERYHRLDDDMPEEGWQ